MDGSLPKNDYIGTCNSNRETIPQPPKPAQPEQNGQGCSKENEQVGELNKKKLKLFKESQEDKKPEAMYLSRLERTRQTGSNKN
ncbi:unnamed protein product [Callosobruchus maculatus]|uniref:Uncharacterized protein n=1 Tax=Callosobruchus maculatus TaxID=64391 RepID=A0A653BPA8_CALMS|nr:unnamed protein product [Callosobruchus maculatus]